MISTGLLLSKRSFLFARSASWSSAAFASEAASERGALVGDALAGAALGLGAGANVLPA